MTNEITEGKSFVQMADAASLAKIAFSIGVFDFEKLPLEQQSDIIVMTGIIKKKIDQFYKERRKVLERNLPDEGIVYENASITWKRSRGSWEVDEKRLVELYPDKAVLRPDPMLVEDLLARAKNAKVEKKDIPEGIVYTEGTSRELLVQTTKPKRFEDGQWK